MSNIELLCKKKMLLIRIVYFISDSQNVQFMFNKNGTLNMFINGFKFYQKDSSHGRTYWHCNKYRSHWYVNKNHILLLYFIHFSNFSDYFFN